MVTASVGDHGPVGAVEKPPEGEVVLRATAWSDWAATGRPLVWSCTATGPATVPAATLNGAEANPNAGVDQVENACQAVVKTAPSTALEHQAGAQAPAPTSSAGTPESLIAAANRSR